MPQVTNVNSEAPRGDTLQGVSDLLATARARAAHAGDLEAPLITACDAVQAAQVLLMRSRERFARLLADSQAAIQIGAENAAPAASGVELRGRGPTASAEPGAALKAKVIAGLRSRVMAEFASEAETIAAEGVDALQGVQQAIASASLMAMTYRALTGQADADAAARLQLLENQIRGGGVDKLWSAYEGYLQSGDDSVCIALEDAGEAFLREVVDGPAATGSANQRNARDGGGPRARARALLDAFEAARARRIPPEIALARLIVTKLLSPAWWLTCGVTGATAPPTMKMGDIAKFSTLPDWQMRSFTRIVRGVPMLGAEAMS